MTTGSRIPLESALQQLTKDELVHLVTDFVGEERTRLRFEAMTRHLEWHPEDGTPGMLRIMDALASVFGTPVKVVRYARTLDEATAKFGKFSKMDMFG